MKTEYIGNFLAGFIIYFRPHPTHSNEEGGIVFGRTLETDDELFVGCELV